MPPIVLTEDAKTMLMNYPWYGNVRELKNITEQIAVVETARSITPDILQNYLSYIPTERMPAIVPEAAPPTAANQITDRELLLKALTMGQMINELRGEINDLRQMVSQLANNNANNNNYQLPTTNYQLPTTNSEEEFMTPEIIEEEAMGLEDRERRAIIKALEHSQGNRKQAAADLHISERTLYRKLKEYNISEN